jgi:hypothetical protein
MLVGRDDDLWVLTTEQPTHACAPPYVANGRLGLRLGALVLGTDRAAPLLTTAGSETCILGTPRFDHTYPLQAFAAHACDGMQLCLPSWANIDLVVGGRRFEPSTLETSSTRPIRTWLDLRSGEAGLDGVWRTPNGPLELRIRLLLPRSCPHGGFWELEIDGPGVPAEIEFGYAGEHCLDKIEQTYRNFAAELRGIFQTRGRGRAIETGLRWTCQSDAEMTTSVGLDRPGTATVRLTASGRKLRLRVYCSIRGGTETLGPSDVRDDLDALQHGVEDGTLRAANRAAWDQIWATGLDVTALPLDRQDQRLVLAQQYYLLASYDGSAHPTVPLGLSSNQWGGMMWDSDLWHFRALNALWPALAQQPVRARLSMLPTARKHAASLGLSGAWFGWMSDEIGQEMAPTHYRAEIHVNAWIALAAWESARRINDPAWTEELFPLLRDLADAICSRAVRDELGGWHLLHVLPPDESVVENPNNPGTCDDSVSTNLAFATALRAALAAARQLGQSAPALWREVADRLVILTPGDDGIIPEYRGYNGHNIKQADLILAFYPLGLDHEDEVVRANLDFYQQKVLWGPLMTEQIDACIRLQRGLGDRDTILRDLLHRYRRYVRGPFEVPYECVDNSNSLMLTACGGLIAALIYGWFGKHQSRQDRQEV